MIYYYTFVKNGYLFPDTIENNIKFGCPNATHEDVVKAAKAARCHDFISALPEGYQTVIGESGATISGGEKQRISIARAIMKDAPIIILDEATANVDPENEAELQRAIEALTQGKTIIMIAHRLKTVKNADQIIVIDRGKISQQGTHDELIKQAGIYADFVGIDITDLSVQPIYEIDEQLLPNMVYSMQPSAITHVVVGGIEQIKNKQRVNLSEENIYKQLQVLLGKLVSQGTV